jgi:hypothetical protein
MESVADDAGREAFAKVLGEGQKHGASVDDPAAARFSNREGIAIALVRPSDEGGCMHPLKLERGSAVL